jgi:transcriptional regulator with XRE-family HTH domain
MKRDKLCIRLKEAMDIRGLRAVDLIERTGIPKVTLSYYMSGKTEPKADRIYTLAKELNVSEAWLMGFDVPMHRTDEQKKNDALAEIVVRLRSDEKLFGLVAKLAAADDAQLDLIDKLVSGLK